MLCLPFHDCAEAGRQLANELRRCDVAPDAVAFGVIPRGMAVAFEVADRLSLPLGAILVRDLDVPWQSELRMGAIAGGVRVLDEGIIGMLNITADEIEEAVQNQTADASHSEALCGQGAAFTAVSGRTALIIDAGIASGIQMVTATRFIREFAPMRIVVAVPVGSREGCRRVANEVDELVCLTMPEHFCAVGEWYREYSEMDDDCVQRYLRANRLSLRRKLPDADHN